MRMDLIGNDGSQVPNTLSSCSSFSTLKPPSLASAASYLLDTHDIPTVQLEHDPSSQTDERASETFIEVNNDLEDSSDETDLVDGQDMKQAKTKATIGLLWTLITYVSLNSWVKTHHPEVFVWSAEDREEAEWIATSRSWLDRKACRWLGVCGGAHMHFSRHHAAAKFRISQDSPPNAEQDWQTAWVDANDRPEDWTGDEKVLREIPNYILEYAPLVHLFSGEEYWPCDIAEHLYHTTPELNYTAIQSESDHPSLKDLDKYNQYQHGRFVFLTSNDNVEEHPDWLEGEKNIPSLPENGDDDDSKWVHYPGRTYLQGIKDAVHDMKEWFGDDDDDAADLKESIRTARQHAKVRQDAREVFHQELKRHADNEASLNHVRGGRSDAPAVLVAINKGNGVVDAFWFFFYSFNQGNAVFNIRFGNHVGDWEHTAIRFHHGQPKAVFFSEHNFGSAYSYEAVEKFGKRPVIYAAVGTHAMYATPGLHPYVLPWGILHDQTDRGPLWDPALNSHAYTYDFKKDILRASNITPTAPTGWFHFSGHWGDKFYPLGDKRQYRFAGQYHYVNGPLGPKFKNLGRKKICGGPATQPCVIKHWLGGEAKAARLQEQGEEADLYSAAAEQDRLQQQA